MADFVLSISDADVERVTSALCSPFDFSYSSQGLAAGEVVGPEVAKARVIQLLAALTMQVESAAAHEAIQASIVPPDMS